MKDFEDNIEGTNEPFVYFKDYEEMNDKFIKEYKKNFSTGKEYQFDLIEGQDINKLMTLNNVTPVQIVPWFDQLNSRKNPEKHFYSLVISELNPRNTVVSDQDRNRGFTDREYSNLPRDTAFREIKQEHISFSKKEVDDIEMALKMLEHKLKYQSKCEIIGFAITDYEYKDDTITLIDIDIFYKGELYNNMDSRVEKHAFNNFPDIDVDQLNDELNSMHYDPNDRWKIVSGQPFPNYQDSPKSNSKFTIFLRQKVSSSLVKFYKPFKMKLDPEFIYNTSQNINKIDEWFTDQINVACTRDELELANIILDYDQNEIYSVYKKLYTV